MGLYKNNDKIGYEAVQVDLENPETYSSLVFGEVPEYLIEHEMRINPDRSLQDLVEDELEE